MGSNFHESFSPGVVQPPTERSTGLVFTTLALIIAYVRRDSAIVSVTATAAAAAFAALSVFAPTLLRPLNLLWFRLSLSLHRVVNPIVMFTIFAVVFVPGGILMRLLRDPLQRRRDPDRRSYWVERTENNRVPASMRHQF
jgi:hypothetical protein